MIHPRHLQHSRCAALGASARAGRSHVFAAAIAAAASPSGVIFTIDPFLLYQSSLFFIARRRMLSITQSDVTPRVRLETSMAHMAEKHIDMLGQVREGQAIRDCCAV